MTPLKSINAIFVKTIHPTNFSLFRVELSSPRFRERFKIPWDGDLENNYEVAQRYLEGKGFNILYLAEVGTGEFIILTDTFKSMKS